MRYTSTGQRTTTSGDDDHRYTIKVFLLRQDRPKYWEFYCPYCGQKIAELNGDVVYMSDITHDSAGRGNTGVDRVRCSGKYCRIWYEFALAS
jgi:hypothetical protein